MENEERTGVEGTDDAFLARVRAEMLGDREAVQAIRDWEDAVGRVEEINGCAACGVEDFQSVSLHSIADLHVLQLSREEVLQNVGSVPEQYRKHFCVHLHGGAWYWLHRELVRGDEAPLCAACKKGVLDTNPAKRMRPKHSIAAGKHFGRWDALPVLTDLERRLLAPVRSAVNTIKLVPSRSAGGAGGGHQWAIRGHTISIPHEGPETVALRLPNLAVLEETKVLFMGPRELFDEINADRDCHSKIERIFSVRWAVLGRWLQVLKAVNPLYNNVDVAVPSSPIDVYGNVMRSVSFVSDASVLAEERVAGADITRMGTANSVGADDAVLLADGSIVPSDFLQPPHDCRMCFGYSSRGLRSRDTQDILATGLLLSTLGVRILENERKCWRAPIERQAD